MATRISRKYLKWNAQVMLVKSGIRRKDHLHDVLNQLGVQIGETQVGRIINDRPARLNIEVLEGLCSAFNCTPNDLLLLVDSEDELGEPAFEVVVDKPKKAARKKPEDPKGIPDMPEMDD